MIPLLCLPKPALDIVLRNMTPMNQFILSLYYEHSDHLMSSLNVGISLRFTIVIREFFAIYVSVSEHHYPSITFMLFENKNGSFSRSEGEPKRTFTDNDPLAVKYHYDADDCGRIIIIAQKSARQWISLIMKVFNWKKIDHLEYLTDDYCFESVKVLLKGLRLETLEVTGDEPLKNYEEILRAVPPCSHLVQRTNPGEKFRNVLMQNFESIDLTFQLNFPDLLSANSRFARISGEKFTIKNMNTFLKLWRKGSSPNAKRFSIKWVPIPDNQDVMDVMKGIPHKTNPDTVERSFLKFSNSSPVAYEKIRGGHDIKRITDGQRATVKLNGRWLAFCFEFFVWDE